MPKVGEIFVDIFANTNRLRGSLAQASSLIRDWSLVVTGLTQGITNAFRIIASVGIKAVVIALGTLTTAFFITAKSGAEFQDNIVRAFVIMRESSGATMESLKELTKEAIRLGSETLFSATQAAVGLQTLARAGFSTQQAIASIGPVLDLAIVGNIELAEASNIAVASMFGFGLEASDMIKVVDVLSLASSQANTTISLLGSALGFVAPVAFSAGIGIQETAAAIGVLSNAGIRGSRAGTTLRRALSILLAPTGRAKKIFDELGLTFNSTEGGLISFVEIIGKLNKANLTAAQTQTIFGRIAGPGMAALLRQGAGALGNLTGKLEGAEGAADRMSQSFRTTVKGRVRDLGASIINLGLAFSERFNKPLSDTIFAIRNYVKIITESLQKTGIFKTIVEGTIASLSPLTNKIKELANNFKEFLLGLTPEDVTSFFEIVRIRIDGFINKLKENRDSIISFFKGSISIIGAFIKPVIVLLKAFDGLSDGMKKTVANVIGLSTALLILTGGIIPLISFTVLLGLAFKPLRLALIAFIGSLIKGTTVMGAFGAASVALKVGLVGLVTSLKAVVIWLGTIVSPILAAAVAGFTLGAAINGLIKGVKALTSGGNFGEAFKKGFTETFTGLINGIKGLFSKLPDIFGKDVAKMKEKVKNADLFSSLPEQLKASMTQAKINLSDITKLDSEKSVTKKVSGNIKVPIARLLSQGIGKPGDTRNELEFQKAANNAVKLGLSFDQLNDVIFSLEKRFDTSFGKINESRREREAKQKVGLDLIQFSSEDLGRLIASGIREIPSFIGPKEKQPGFGIGKNLEKTDLTTTEQGIRNAIEQLNTGVVGTDSKLSEIQNQNREKIINLLKNTLENKRLSDEERIVAEERFGKDLDELSNLSGIKTGRDDISINSNIGNAAGIQPK